MLKDSIDYSGILFWGDKSDATMNDNYRTVTTAYSTFSYVVPFEQQVITVNPEPKKRKFKVTETKRNITLED
jgi:hypothetical protein